MEHPYIEEHNIADLYLLGKLSAEEETRFEEHCENCRQCFDRLGTIDGLRRGLRIVAGENVWRPRAYIEVGSLAWVVRLSRASQAILLAGVILLIVLPAGLLILEWSRARRNLAQATRTAEEWRRKYEEREQADLDLMKEAQARDRQSFARQDRLAAQPEGEGEDRTRPANDVGQAAPSQAAVPVFALSVARSGDVGPSQPVSRIKLSRASKLIILLLDLGPDTDFQSYRAAISTARGRSVWRESQLKPNSDDMLALSFNSSLFKPGDYLMTLEGLTGQKRYMFVARYTFRVFRQ